MRTVVGIATACLACTVSLLGTSCKTVSDKAPGEIQDAQKKLSEAQKEDIDNSVPIAMELAQRKMARSLELLDDATDYRNRGQKEQADATEKQAIAVANEARVIAQMGLDLKRDAQSFDENLTDYVPLMARAGESSNLTGELSELRRQNAELTAKYEELVASSAEGPESVIPEDFRMAKPVAFFSTGSTKLQARYRNDVREVADILKANPELTLTLEGFADPRGSAELNQKLAEERANAVSQFLIDQGVAEDRISVTVVGSTADSAGGRDLADLQLDRKVVAKFEAVAH